MKMHMYASKFARRIAILAFLLLLGCAPAINAINQLSGRSEPLAPAQYRLPERGMPAASPPPWAQLDLQGRLILIRYDSDGYQLIEVDLSTGNTKSLLQTPQNSLLTGADVSPDGSKIILAYAAPPEDGQMQLGYTRLFVMPSNGPSQPEPFLTSTYPDEAFYHPVWSPDGQHVYYTHLYRRDADEPAGNYRIEKAALSGEPEVIVEDAIWPGISPDGSKLAYLTFEPGASDNELYVMNMIQKETAPVITTGEFPTVDAHVFTPDGDEIYFSAVNTRTSGNWWFDSIDGVDIAFAHNVPSDWYRVAVQGGDARRVTQIDGTGLVGDFSPDGQYFVFFSQAGLFVMKPDGSDLLAMANETLLGTVDWLP